MVVVVVVAGVLVHGALDRTAQAEREPSADPDSADIEPPPPPAPARPARLGGLEKTPLTYFSDYWAQLAAEVAVHVVAVGPAGDGGLVIERGLALTTRAAADALASEAARTRLARAAVTPDLPDAEPPTRIHPAVRAVDDRSGLALIEIPRDIAPFETGSARALRSGSYVGAVAWQESGTPSIAPGYLVSAAGPVEPAGDLVLSLVAPPDAVAAVVDLDGNLIGVTFHAPDGTRALSVRALGRLIEAMQRDEPCRAIEVAGAAPGVLELLDLDTGVVVERVVAEAFDPEPSLRPGDLLVEWGGEPVVSTDDFYARYEAVDPGTLVRYRVVRGRRPIAGGTVVPGPGCGAPPPPVVRLVRIGLVVGWSSAGARPDAGWRITTLAPGGVAERAGMREGDRLVAIDGRAVGQVEDGARIARLGEGPRPALVSLFRDGRVTLAAVAAPES